MSCSKKFFAVLFYLWSSLAWAGVNCTDLPNFVPGTTADALAVNARFANVVSCFSLAAQTGNNNDITALFALTSPINPAQGGSTIYVGGASTGSANAQVLAALSPTTGFSLTRGLSILFTVGGGLTNTGPATLAVTTPTIAATNIFRPTPSGPQALVDGELIAGNLALVIYDGTQFQLAWTGAQSGGFGPLMSLSSTVPDLGTIPSHNITFTGTTTIMSFGSSASVTYPYYRLNFTTSLTLMHNGTSLILPSSQNIQTANGDTAIAMYLGSGNWQVISYNRATGTSVVSPTPLCGFSGLSASTVSDTQINWFFTNSVLLTTGNIPLYSGAKSGAVTVTTGTGGTPTAGGMDGSPPSANAFIYLYAISDGSTWNVIGSNTIPTTFLASPNFPSGYRYLCYMGAMKALNATHVYNTRIAGNEARYIVNATFGSLPTAPPLIDSVALGALPKGSNCAVAMTTYVTETVRGDSGAGIWMPSTSVLGNFTVSAVSTGITALASNSTYTGISGGQQFQSNGTAISTIVPILMEGNAVFWCNVTASSQLFQYGWKDAVNAN
jgi:hypothetical protein